MVVAAMSAAASIFNPALDALLLPLSSTHSRAQFFFGFDCLNLRRGVSSRHLIHRVDKVHCRCGKDDFQEYAGSLEQQIGHLKDNERATVDALVSAIVQQAEVEGSLTLAFKKISIEDWSKVLSNVGKRHWELALGVFGIFKETSTLLFKPDNGTTESEVLKVYTTMVTVLSKHGKLEEAEAIVLEVQQLGFGLDLILYNALLAGYARKGMAQRMLDCMLQMQRTGLQPNCVTYEQLIAAYLNMKSPEVPMALGVLDHMHATNMKPSFKTYAELINACWHRSAVEDAEKCFSAMINAGYSADAKTFYKMMQLHARKGDHVRTEELFLMLKQAGLHPTSMCYEHVLLAYCKAGYVNQAFNILREAKRVSKPSIVLYNMLLDACSRAGLHLQAMQLYNEICHSGVKANAVTYTSAITALVRSGRFNKAEDLYRKMIKHNIVPTALTYTTMINSYTVRGWTRFGHEIVQTMRNSNCIISTVAYNAMLNLYLHGSWFTEGAKVVDEMNAKGIEPSIAGYGIIISACGESSPDVLPLIKAIQSSQWETCQIIHQLLFQQLFESSESLLEGNIAELPKDIFSFLRNMAMTKGVETNLSLYNSLMDSLWRKGLKRRAKSVMLAARSLLPWYKRPKYTTAKLTLDLRGLSVGAAQVSVLDCLNTVAVSSSKKDFTIVLMGGTGYEAMKLEEATRGNTKLARKKKLGGVRKTIGSFLAELGSPFLETPDGTGKLLASASEVVEWQRQYGISSALMLLDSNHPYITQ